MEAAAVLNHRRWTAFSLGRTGDSADSTVLHGRDDIERALDHDFEDGEHKGVFMVLVRHNFDRHEAYDIVSYAIFRAFQAMIFPFILLVFTCPVIPPFMLGTP